MAPFSENDHFFYIDIFFCGISINNLKVVCNLRATSLQLTAKEITFDDDIMALFYCFQKTDISHFLI